MDYFYDADATCQGETLTRKKGFTLVELLMVIAIIGIFTSVVFVSLDGSRAKSRDAVRVGDLKTLSYAAQTYFQENNGEFPDSIDNLAPYYEGGSVPADPLGDPYYYSFDDITRKYCLGAETETMDQDASCGLDVRYTIQGP